MHKNFFHDILSFNPELMQGIIAFNMRFQNPALAQDFAENHNIMHLNSVMQELWAIAEVQKTYAPSQSFWDFENESRRLALLDEETLKKLMLYMGAALNATAIVRCVAQKDVLQLQDGLGLAAFNFASHRGQFVLGDNANALFHFLEHEKLLNRIFLSGVFAIHFCSFSFPTILYAVIRQAIESLAQDFNFESQDLWAYIEKVPTADLTNTQLQHLWFSVKKILLKEVAPQWKPYFNV